MGRHLDGRFGPSYGLNGYSWPFRDYFLSESVTDPILFSILARPQMVFCVVKSRRMGVQVSNCGCEHIGVHVPHRIVGIGDYWRLRIGTRRWRSYFQARYSQITSSSSRRTGHHQPSLGREYHPPQARLYPQILSHSILSTTKVLSPYQGFSPLPQSLGRCVCILSVYM